MPYRLAAPAPILRVCHPCRRLASPFILEFFSSLLLLRGLAATLRQCAPSGYATLPRNGLFRCPLFSLLSFGQIPFLTWWAGSFGAFCASSVCLFSDEASPSTRYLGPGSLTQKTANTITPPPQTKPHPPPQNPQHTNTTPFSTKTHPKKQPQTPPPTQYLDYSLTKQTRFPCFWEGRVVRLLLCFVPDIFSLDANYTNGNECLRVDPRTGPLL